MDSSPFVAGPYRSLRSTVPEEWIDVNGHMNARYYGLVIYDAHAAFTTRLGLGDDYVERTQCGKVVAESHVVYERELRRGDEMAVYSWLVGVDAKRLHFFHELWSLTAGHRAATGEQMDLHVDLRSRTVTPLPEDVRARLAAVAAAQSAQGTPAGTGRRVRSLAPGGRSTE
jgi:acyl-CoA thioester hydrolase